MANLIYRTAQIVRAENAPMEDRSFEIVASTEDIDTHDSIVESSWKLERYLKNPVVLYGHNRFPSMPALPIGTSSNTRVENKQLRSRIEIVGQDEHPFADNILAQIRKGRLRGLSVGFNPGNGRIETREKREILILSNNELIEISVEPTQSNENALIELRSMARKAMNVSGKTKGKLPPGQRADEPTREGAPPISDQEAATAYISAAPGDVEGLDPEMAKQVSAVIATRVGACFEAGGAALEEDPNARAICKALSTKENTIGTLEEALAVVEAMKQNATSGTISAEAQERASLIQGAITDTRISEGMRSNKEYMESLNKYSMPALRAHLKSLKPTLPLGKRNETAKPGAKDDTPDIGDKPWDKLTYPERAAIQRSDPARAKAMKAAVSKNK